jgi:hypothetical protein
MTLDYFTIKRFHDSSWQERVRMPVDKLLVIESITQKLSPKSTGIQRAFEYWHDKKRRGRVRVNDFEWIPSDDVATTLVDVSPLSPFHYRFMSHNLRYFHWMVEKPLAEFPHREIIEACSLEYHACKIDAEPVGHHISHDLNGFNRDYLRLLLPLTNQHGDVSVLACVSRHLGLSTRAGSLPTTPGG